MSLVRPRLYPTTSISRVLSDNVTSCPCAETQHLKSQISAVHVARNITKGADHVGKFISSSTTLLGSICKLEFSEKVRKIMADSWQMFPLKCISDCYGVGCVKTRPYNGEARRRLMLFPRWSFGTRRRQNDTDPTQIDDARQKSIPSEEGCLSELSSLSLHDVTMPLYPRHTSSGITMSPCLGARPFSRPAHIDEAKLTTPEASHRTISRTHDP